MASDYFQIELRIPAHLSGDAGLHKAFAEDQDIHLATAAEVPDRALDAVTDEERRSAKAINWFDLRHVGIGLGRQLNIPELWPRNTSIATSLGIQACCVTWMRPAAKQHSRATSKPFSAGDCICRNQRAPSHATSSSRAHRDQCVM